MSEVCPANSVYPKNRNCYQKINLLARACLPHPMATALDFAIKSVCCKQAGLTDFVKVAGCFIFINAMSFSLVSLLYPSWLKNFSIWMSTSSRPLSLTFRLRSPNRIIVGATRSALLQCAAVRTKRSLIKLPPHEKENSPFKFGYPIAAMCGNSAGFASTPPTTNPVTASHSVYETSWDDGSSESDATWTFLLMSFEYSTHSAIQKSL